MKTKPFESIIFPYNILYAGCFAVVFLCSICLSNSLSAQDLEEQYFNTLERVKKNPLKVNGGVNLTANGVLSTLEPSRATPFSGRGTAFLNFDFLGISAPFTMAFSTGGRAFNYTLPAYAFAGISPSYKWAKMHFGDRSINMGKYTFNRQSFRGIGTELSPGKWKAKAFYGRIRRARPQDVNAFQRIDPLFKRIGTGINFGYDNKGDKLMLGFLNASDRLASLGAIDSTLLFNPGANTILSLSGSKNLSSKLSLLVDWARSAYTENTLDLENVNRSFVYDYIGIHDVNGSTRWGSALTTQLKLKVKKSELDISYERVAPSFKTMGALFYRSDFENISSGIKFSALKNRLITAGRIGVERNNLKNTNAHEYNRFLFSLNSNWRVSKILDVGFNASTFNNTIIQSVPLSINNPISLNQLVSTSTNIGVTGNIILSETTEHYSSLNTMLGRNVGFTVINDELQNDKVTSDNIFLIYTRKNLQSKLQFGGQLSFINTQIVDSKIKTSSLGISLSKPFKHETLNVSLLLGGGMNTGGSGGVDEQVFYTQNTISINYKISDHVSAVYFASIFKNFGPDKGTRNRFFENRNLLTLSYKF